MTIWGGGLFSIYNKQDNSRIDESRNFYNRYKRKIKKRIKPEPAGSVAVRGKQKRSVDTDKILQENTNILNFV